jgi:hypothetical protein
MHNAADSKNCKKNENNTPGESRMCCFVAHFRPGLVFFLLPLVLGAHLFLICNGERPGFKETRKKLCFSGAAM